MEAFINPVVATMFHKEKTKWLNILHAGWPGGLVLGGLLTIWLGNKAAEDWRILIYLIAIPAVVFLVMLIKANFPVNERVAAGTSYKEMLAEFGAIGALIASALIFGQLGQVFGLSNTAVLALIALATIGYGIYCKSIGRPILIFLCIIMMPLATTELGTDGAITGIMEEPMTAAGYHPLWVLIYTSAIMAILRFFFAGPIVQKLTPIGLLILSAALAIAGLFFLSTAKGLAIIFVFATLYGFGKTFFWPTMLGIVSEQCPKGGALTLNAIAGIGMLTVGIVGGPLIGKMQEDVVAKKMDADTYASISVEAKQLPTWQIHSRGCRQGGSRLETEAAAKINEEVKVLKQGDLANITIFPIFMLGCYIALLLYFKQKGGYKPVEIGH